VAAGQAPYWTVVEKMTNPEAKLDPEFPQPIYDGLTIIVLSAGACLLILVAAAFSASLSMLMSTVSPIAKRLRSICNWRVIFDCLLLSNDLVQPHSASFSLDQGPGNVDLAPMNCSNPGSMTVGISAGTKYLRPREVRRIEVKPNPGKPWSLRGDGVFIPDARFSTLYPMLTIAKTVTKVAANGSYGVSVMNSSQNPVRIRDRRISLGSVEPVLDYEMKDLEVPEFYNLTVLETRGPGDLEP
jgi:hypothetical protein